MTDVNERLQAALAERYTIERELGRGGMATVYLARDHKLDRAVALKVLTSSRSTAPPRLAVRRYGSPLALTFTS